MWLYRTELILSFHLYYLNFTASKFADTAPEDEMIVSKRVIPIWCPRSLPKHVGVFLCLQTCF